MKAHVLTFLGNADYGKNPTNGVVGSPERIVRLKVQVITEVARRQLPQLDGRLDLDVHGRVVRPQFGPRIHELHVRLLEIHRGRAAVEETAPSGDRL